MPSHGQILKPQVRIGKSPDDCWQWLGPTTANGHGKKTYCGKNIMAHRWIWEMLFGPIADGLVVYRTCATHACVNPHHLACGYQADAVRASNTAKLLPQDIADIRAARGTQTLHTVQHLADRYGVTAGTIRSIWAGRSWGKRKKHTAPNTRATAQ